MKEFEIFSSGKIPLIYSTEWFLIAVFFGIIIGIAAGVLPARKAAKMDPVIALRYDWRETLHKNREQLHLLKHTKTNRLKNVLE